MIALCCSTLCFCPMCVARTVVFALTAEASRYLLNGSVPQQIPCLLDELAEAHRAQQQLVEVDGAECQRRQPD